MHGDSFIKVIKISFCWLSHTERKYLLFWQIYFLMKNIFCLQNAFIYTLLFHLPIWWQFCHHNVHKCILKTIMHNLLLSFIIWKSTFRHQILIISIWLTEFHLGKMKKKNPFFATVFLGFLNQISIIPNPIDIFNIIFKVLTLNLKVIF